MRKATISGRLAADAEVQQTKNGHTFVQFRMATQEYNEQEPTWVTVTSWNAVDINRAQSVFKKGYAVNVGGSWRVNAYVSQKNGQAGVQFDLTADWIELAFSKSNDENNNGAAPAATTAPQATAAATKATPRQRVAPATAATAVPAQVVNNMPVDSNDAGDDLPF